MNNLMTGYAFPQTNPLSTSANLYGNRMAFQAPQTNNGINWVQGIEGAKAFQMVPNSNTILMDSENNGRFYIKISDNVGMCNLRVFAFEEITDKAQAPVDTSQFVTREELTKVINDLKGGMKNEQSVSTIESNTELNTRKH